MARGRDKLEVELVERGAALDTDDDGAWPAPDGADALGGAPPGPRSGPRWRRPGRRTVAVVVGVLAVPLVLTAFSTWREERQVARTVAAVSSSSMYVESLGPDLETVWTADLATAWISRVVDGVVVTQDWSTLGFVLVGLDLATGEPLWSFGGTGRPLSHCMPPTGHEDPGGAAAGAIFCVEERFGTEGLGPEDRHIWYDEVWYDEDGEVIALDESWFTAPPMLYVVDLRSGEVLAERAMEVGSGTQRLGDDLFVSVPDPAGRDSWWTVRREGAADGRVRWEVPVEGPPRPTGMVGSLLNVSVDPVYEAVSVSTATGVVLLDLDGAEVARWEPPEPEPELHLGEVYVWRTLDRFGEERLLGRAEGSPDPYFEVLEVDGTVVTGGPGRAYGPWVDDGSAPAVLAVMDDRDPMELWDVSRGEPLWQGTGDGWSGWFGMLLGEVAVVEERSGVHATYGIDARSGAVRWTHSWGGRAQLVGTDGRHLFVWHFGEGLRPTVTAVRVSTGEEVWAVPVGEPHRGPDEGQYGAMLVDGHLFVHDGRTVSLLRSPSADPLTSASTS